ncbi:hypothetical protein M3Y99_00647700 [Aphelenchoides fujianensis]|nr:hypothetical protein M3Y99_00647700 [Aphelenchoides fujianensis]
MISSAKLRAVGKVGLLAVFLLTAALFVWPSGERADVKETPPSTSSPPVDECDCEGEDFCFSGLDAKGRTVKGRPFDCALLDGLRRFDLTRAAIARTPAVHERPPAAWTPRFVSALSSDHFAEGHRLVASIRRHYPEAPIIFVLNASVVERVERNRRRAMEPLFRLVELRRSNSMRDLPHLRCNASTLRPE